MKIKVINYVYDDVYLRHTDGSLVVKTDESGDRYVLEGDKFGNMFRNYARCLIGKGIVTDWWHRDKHKNKERREDE